MFAATFVIGTIEVVEQARTLGKLTHVIKWMSGHVIKWMRDLAHND